MHGNYRLYRGPIVGARQCNMGTNMGTRNPPYNR